MQLQRHARTEVLAVVGATGRALGIRPAEPPVALVLMPVAPTPTRARHVARVGRELERRQRGARAADGEQRDRGAAERVDMAVELAIGLITDNR